MLQFSYIQEVDFSKGVDQSNHTTIVQPGFLEDAVNVDPSGFSLAKRTGFEKLGGDVPVVLQAITTSAGVTTLTFPGTIALDEVDESSSLWIHGRAEYTTGFKEIDYTAYGFTRIDTYTLDKDIGALAVNVVSEFNLTDYTALISLYAVDSGDIIYTNRNIDPTTGDMALTFSLDENVDVQFITKDCSGDCYTSGALPMDAGVQTITAATHGLSIQLIPTFYKINSATNYEWILPDRFTILPTGDVEIEFLSASGGDTCEVQLIEAGHFLEGTAPGGETETTVIIPAAETEYLLAACYIDPAATDEYSLVLPNSITYDSVQQQHSVTFLHDGLGGLTNYKIIYTYGNVATNRCTITGLTDTSGAAIPNETLSKSIVTVTGLNNENISGKPAVNFIDKYEAADETVIASGGQLFRSYDPQIVESYDFRNRMAADTVVGPTFTKAAYARTGGCIVCADATNAGQLRVVSITNIANKNFLVTVEAVGHSILNSAGAPTTLASVILSGTRITISGSKVAAFNASHAVSSPLVVDADTLSFVINVPNARSGTRDNDNESGALAGIYTDRFTFQTEALFAADDIVTLTPTLDVVAISSNSTLLLADSVEEVVNLYVGQRLGPTAEKSSVVVPGMSDLVAGDIVEVSGITTRISSAQAGISSTELIFRDAVTVSNGQIDLVCPIRWQVIRTSDAFLGTAPVSAATRLRSVAGKGSLYITGGVKYDGDKIYTSGVPKFQMHLAVGVDESIGSKIVVDTTQVAITGGAGTNTVTIAVGDINKFQVGDQVMTRSAAACDITKVYLIEDISSAGVVKLNKATDVSDTLISSFVAYRYFMRLSLLDRNGSLAVSRSLGDQDLLVRLTDDAGVHLSGTVFPADIDPIDYDNLYVEIFRARETQTVATDFYRVGSINLSSESLKFTFLDAVSDSVAEVSSNKDQITSPIPGDIGTVRDRMPRTAAFLTTINNQMVVGDYYGDTEAKVAITGSASYSAFQEKEFVVTTTSGDTDFYVCKDADRSDVSPTISGTTVTLTHPALGAQIAEGQIILVTRQASKLVNSSPLLVGWWEVIAGGSTTTTKFTLPGAPASFTSAEDSNLVMYYKADKIPLVSDLTYAPISGSAEQALSISAGLGLHLAQAINSVMIGEYITAFGGKGQINFETTIAGSSLLGVTVPSVTNAQIFCNGRLGTTTAAATTLRFGSRVALSIKGSPEVFDGVTATNVNALPLAQDVNPEDGENVAMAIPFFATAAFGAAQQSNVLLIFKDHSAYLLDPQGKYVGSSDVFKQIDTSGYGCECPLSVINSQIGILFVNTTGIYLIDRQFKFTRIGNYVSNYITRGIFTPNSSTAAVNDISGEKLMFTSGDATLVLHLPTAEGGSVGWTRYEGLPATCWAHRDNAFIFSTDLGFVGISSDRYADAGASIKTTILLRNIDAGMPTVKKVMRHMTMVASAETTYARGEIDASMAVDFTNNFEDMDECTLTGSTAVYVDGLSDYIRPAAQLISFSPATAKAGWYQFKLITDKLDADFLLARIVMRVAGIRERADIQAAETE